MKITKLKLTNFRNYPKLELDFSKSKNIIIGNNGSGKTNIIESIFYLSLTKSFRTNTDTALIKDDSDYAVIEAKIKDKITNTYRIVINKENKKITIDGTQISKIGDYISKINTILFSTEDMKLVKDNPSIHRKLINMELSSFDNEYLKLLSLYNRVLKQRNTYLKSMMTNSMIPKSYLDILTNKLIDLNIQISQKRAKFIEQINTYLPYYFEKITGKTLLKLKYISNIKNLETSELQNLYAKSFQKDLNYGKTNHGIHLDDYVFEFNNKNIKDYLSEGETKNAIIAMKLSEIEYCKVNLKKEPILLLDDLFSELDKTKINNILQYLDKDIQIFITTTDIHKVSRSILNNCNVYKISKGKIKVTKYEWKYL